MLVLYAIKAPIFGYLWQLDKIVYHGYLTQQVEPVFIIGEPRSGTTFIHRTLAMDEENFFAIRHIEWRYPFITIQNLLSWFELQKSIQNINYWPNNAIGKEAKKMHSNTLFDFEEDGIFFEECFLFHFFTLFRFPYQPLLNYLDAFEELDQQDRELILKTHREVIQKIMFLRGSSKVYLSKEVTSHTKLNMILSMYPTAKFIINLRHSNEFMSSLLRLIQVSTLCKTGVDIYAEKCDFKSLLIKRMQNDCSLLVDFIEGENFDTIAKNTPIICIAYSNLTEDTITSIQYIYQKLRMNISPVYLNKLESIEQGQQNRERGYNYQKEQFEGFDPFNQLVSKYSKKIFKADSFSGIFFYRKDSINDPGISRRESMNIPFIYRKDSLGGFLHSRKCSMTESVQSKDEPINRSLLYKKESMNGPLVYRRDSVNGPLIHRKDSLGGSILFRKESLKRAILNKNGTTQELARGRKDSIPEPLLDEKYVTSVLTSYRRNSLHVPSVSKNDN